VLLLQRMPLGDRPRAGNLGHQLAIFSVPVAIRREWNRVCVAHPGNNVR
jgi:hypothetical protein